VAVKEGALYHVASVAVLGPDGKPLPLPPGAAALPLRPGQTALTAPVVATENVLLAAFGNNGHPFAKIEKREVVIDRAAYDDRDLLDSARPGNAVWGGRDIRSD
jgi:translocation and assembly module TamA